MLLEPLARNLPTDHLAQCISGADIKLMMDLFCLSPFSVLDCYESSLYYDYLRPFSPRKGNGAANQTGKSDFSFIPSLFALAFFSTDEL